MDPSTRRIVLGLGLLLVLASPAFLWHTCADDATASEGGAEEARDAASGFELRGFTGLTVTYSPDGVRTCTAGMGPVYLPVGLGLVVLASVR